MARLTPEQWQAARADYEIRGMSQREIAEKYGISAGAVGQKASKEQWKLSSETKQLVTEKANAVITLANINAQTKQKLSAVETKTFDSVVADEIAFRLQSDERMQAVEDKVMALLPLVERPTDAKTIMETLRIHREARLGKSPDTQVNIQQNNELPPRIERVIIDPKARDAD